MSKPKVYIETSVVSYLVSRPSRNPLVLGQQQATKKWWDNSLDLFTPHVSTLVLEEVGKGDAAMAEARRTALRGIDVLADAAEALVLTSAYMKRIGFPDSIRPDAYHMAMASWHRIDFLATWNCKHIASGWIRRLVKEINESFGLPSPELCTPLELKDFT